MTPPPNFDRLAGAYLWLERLTFGNLLWKCRCAHIEELRACRTALVIGDGDGRFTARLLEMNPLIRVDAVDSSRAMLQALIRRAGVNADRVRVHHVDARILTPPRSHFDLVVTHFFFDCLTTDEVSCLANRLRPAIDRTSLWVVSDFAIPPGWFGLMIARPLVTGLYLAFAILARTRVFSLPDHNRALVAAGLTLRSTKELARGLLSSEIWTAAHA
jgi:hypothetical protein